MLLHAVIVTGHFGLPGNVNQTFWLHPPNLIGAESGDSESLNGNKALPKNTKKVSRQLSNNAFKECV